VRISLDGVSKHYGARTILDKVTLAVTPERRLGVVGPNGVGKSTLLLLIAGLDEPDSGVVARSPATLTAGYLPQEHGGDPVAGARTVLDTFRADVIGYEDEARAFLDKFLFTGEQVLRRVNQLSYGERAKLALLIRTGAVVL